MPKSKRDSQSNLALLFFSICLDNELGGDHFDDVIAGKQIISCSLLSFKDRMNKLI